MEEPSSKSSRIPIKSYTNPSLQIINKTCVPASNVHGIKLSMNMSSEAKRDFYLKFEEWRQKKRENIIKKACEVKNENENHQTKTESLAPKNKSSSSTGKNFQGRESVFERLYKNSKAPQNKGKENIETVNKIFAKNIESPIVPELKKKNDMLKADKLEINHSNIDGSAVLLTNKYELESNVIVRDIGDIADNEDNIDNIVKLTDNSPRTTFVVATKEMPITETEITEILNHENDFNSEEAVSKSNEMIVQNTALKPMEEATGNNSSAKDPLFIKEVKVYDNWGTSEENQETLNKTFNIEDNSVQIKDGVSQLSNDSKTFIKPLSVKLNEKIESTDLKKGNYVNNDLDKKEPQKYVRKSISSIHFQKCGIPQKKSTMKNITSERNNHPLKPTPVKKEIDGVFQSNKEKNKPLVIKGIPPPITPLRNKKLTSSCLRSKLEDWLTLNNHSLEGYRHLRCFGFNDSSDVIGQTPIKSTKKNFTTIEEEVLVEEDCNKENLLPPVATEQATLIDENRLKELYKLIVELKYDPDRCEDWLIAIRKKNPRVTDLPIYWECLAALNQDNEDIKSAVEQYEKVLAKEEEEKESTDSSLAQLFDKLLIDQNKPNEHKLEKGMDPKNIFRSTIIKFSLQQKPNKESSAKEGEENNTNTLHYVATPVRRSSRLWTPKKSNVVNSLQTLNPQIRENVTFKANDSLLN